MAASILKKLHFEEQKGKKITGLQPT